MNHHLFPITIIDNFYKDPDSVRELALNQKEWNPDPDGRWPGVRTKNIQYIDTDLYDYFCKLLVSVFYDQNNPFYIDIATCFQNISPRHEDKYHPKNKGYLHMDGCLFGGLIYLNKQTESDTGTSLYTPDNGYYSTDNSIVEFKKNDYLGKIEPTDEQYNEVHSISKNGLTETVKIENVYNRCILFSGNQHHAAQTFGSIGDRLTQVFFCFGLETSMPYPLSKPIE